MTATDLAGTAYTSALHSARSEAALTAEAVDRLIRERDELYATVRAVEAVCANVLADAADTPDGTIGGAVDRIRAVTADMLTPPAGLPHRRPDVAVGSERQRAVAAVHIHMARCGGGPDCAGPDDTDQDRGDRLLAALQPEEANHAPI